LSSLDPCRSGQARGRLEVGKAIRWDYLAIQGTPVDNEGCSAVSMCKHACGGPLWVAAQSMQSGHECEWDCRGRFMCTQHCQRPHAGAEGCCSLCRRTFPKVKLLVRIHICSCGTALCCLSISLCVLCRLGHLLRLSCSI
jgi:hypothetical protein